MVGAAVQGAPTRGGEAAGGGRRAVVGAPYLGLATVALLPTLHKAVPTHGAAHQAVGVRGVGQAAGAGILHEPLQVHLAALAEPPGQWGAAGEGVPSGGWGWWAGHRPPRPRAVALGPAGRVSPNAGRHDAAAAVPRFGAVATLDVVIVVHAQVVAHLVGHGARHTHRVLAVVLWGGAVRAAAALLPALRPRSPRQARVTGLATLPASNTS